MHESPAHVPSRAPVREEIAELIPLPSRAPAMSSAEVVRTARRLPPGYRLWTAELESGGSVNGLRPYVRLYADDGTVVLSGTVEMVHKNDSVTVDDYALQEAVGAKYVHADTRTMIDAAWTHYRMRVHWWHRYVTQYATTWAVAVALLLGVVSVGLAVQQSRQSAAMTQEIVQSIRDNGTYLPDPPSPGNP